MKNDVEMWIQYVPSGTKLPQLKQMDLLKKVIGRNLLVFNNKFLVLNKIFDILNL